MAAPQPAVDVPERPPSETPAAPQPAAAAPPAPAAAEEVAVSAEPITADDGVRTRVLEIVSEQTGYPADMLELDLDLEADLGIDTVKQAEMFAAIREAYGIERDEELALRDYPTLGHAIEFVYEKRPDLRPGGAEAGDEASAAQTPAAAQHGAALSAMPSTPGRPVASMEAAQAVPRRVPVPVLRPAARRFEPSGVGLERGDGVVIVMDRGGVGRALAARLAKRGVRVLSLGDDAEPGTLLPRIEAWEGRDALRGVYWLAALDRVSDEDLMDPARRSAALDHRVIRLHEIARALYDDLGRANRFFVSATRCGGLHGYGEDGATDAAGGAVAGFTKALARERPEALVKVVDFAPSRKTAAPAELLLDEVLHDRGPVEVGYAAAGLRWTVALDPRPLDAVPQLPEAWRKEGVYVVTGAAGSIVSAIVADLAAASGGTFWLLDLTPAPDPADPDLDRLHTDPNGLKRDLAERLRALGERATPVAVTNELGRLERADAARRAIGAVQAAGGTAYYRAVDLLDEVAVAKVMREIVERNGRVDVLIHAAGLEVSRALPDKSPEEFRRVFGVKVAGWCNLMRALRDVPLGCTVAFGSIAGRFGNAGQTDYSAANDFLCRAASRLRGTRPDTRALVIDWTAWSDIGMASRGSIPAVMRQAGIDMLPPAAGIPVVRREIAAGARGEVVIAEALGRMIQEDDGFGVLAVVAPEERDAPARGPMVDRIRRFGVHDGLVVDVTLDPERQPFLMDHRIDGTAVLPGVMGLEAMAEVARLAFPDRAVAAIEDVDFLAPFKFYRDDPRTLTVMARFRPDGGDIVADCRVLGSRTLHGREAPEVTTHFTGRVRLAAAPRDDETRRDVPGNDDGGVERGAIYHVYFHGPAYQVMERAWRHGNELAGAMAEDLPPAHEPSDRPTELQPRLVELGFQTAGLAEIAETGRLGLPFHVDRVEWFGTGSGNRQRFVALARHQGEGFDIDIAGRDGRVAVRLRGYRTAPLPGTVDTSSFRALAP